LPIVEWLNRLKKRKENRLKGIDADADFFQPENPHLLITLPHFNHTVVYYEPVVSKNIRFWQPDACPEIKSHLIYDFIPKMDSPTEALERRFRRSAYQRELDETRKPNLTEQRELDQIIKSLSKQELIPEHKNLLFTFRYYIKNNQKALTKFLRCIEWDQPAEVEEGLDLMRDWAELQTIDALELLTNAFKNQEVRDFAVARLKSCDEDEFFSYLMELVKALRFEPDYPSALSEFLITRGCKSFSTLNFLYWNAKTDKLADPDNYKQFFEDIVEHVSENYPKFKDELDRQDWLVQELVSLTDLMKKAGNSVQQKQKFTESVSPNGKFSHLLKFPKPVKLPTKPEATVYGIIPEKTKVFKSALCPMGVCFLSDDGKTESVLWKNGDDLRQDQMIMQFVKLMDSLLKRKQLDVKLTPYTVLATSPDSGFLEFVNNSDAVANVIAENNGKINEFLNIHNPKPKLIAKAMDNFKKSCAGYSVITYILGIGDRHLDNLLLTTDGRLVHIDFGFIFGDDPKKGLGVPPMKICKEMIECMGGKNDPMYKQFQQYIVMVFRTLRQHANVILNLIALMSDDSTAHGVSYVEDNFDLKRQDREAERKVLNLVEQSVDAFMPRVLDVAHKWATYFR